jgi:hypothetical protein
MSIPKLIQKPEGRQENYLLPFCEEVTNIRSKRRYGDTRLQRFDSAITLFLLRYVAGQTVIDKVVSIRQN